VTRLHESTMRALVEDIARGRIAPGEWLPREVDIARQFDVSRGVARETIRALEERSVVAVRHGRGARVRPLEEWDLLDERVLAALEASGRADEVVREALECRRLLESEAAAQAAARIRPEGARELTEALARLRATVEEPRAGSDPANAVADFRGVVARLSGNRPLGRMLFPLDAVDAATVRGLDRSGLDELLARHERILSAISAGDDGAAREAVHADVEAMAEAVLESGRRRRGA
jgi:DNA-binding FadR family transcriptional regulator